MKEMQDKIVKLLEGYTFREKKIALLRHEWYRPNQVTPEEMLEAMAYSRNTDGGAPVCGHISDKTYHIALNYEDQAARQNREQIENISTDLERLERVQYRLGYCVSQLPKPLSTIIQELYIRGKERKDIILDLGLSESTFRRYRQKAIEDLAEMYLALQSAGVVLEWDD